MSSGIVSQILENWSANLVDLLQGVLDNLVTVEGFNISRTLVSQINVKSVANHTAKCSCQL